MGCFFWFFFGESFLFALFTVYLVYLSILLCDSMCLLANMDPSAEGYG